MKQVEDPELGMDIVDLGLLYDVEVDGPKVKVIHSLTSMGCPAGPMIQENIHDVAAALPGVEEVEVELTWEPPWTPEQCPKTPSSSSASAKTFMPGARHRDLYSSSLSVTRRAGSLGRCARSAFVIAGLDSLRGPPRRPRAPGP